MADISQVKLPNGDTFDLVDEKSGYTKNTGTITSVKTTAGAHTTINVTSGAANFNVPTATSHLTNDNGYLTLSTLPYANEDGYGIIKIEEDSGLKITWIDCDSNELSYVVPFIDYQGITSSLSNYLDLNYTTNGNYRAVQKDNNGNLYVVQRDISNSTNGGLSIGSTPSGGISIGHSNILASAQTTQAVYPIKIDKNGHISAYGSAVTIPTVPTNISSFTNDSGYLTLATLPIYDGTVE